VLTVDDDAEWLKAVDWHITRGYRPVLVVFQDATGNLAVQSIFGEEERAMLAFFAGTEVEPTDPEPKQ
jgi:hypothetical protein